jgi:hypothetical protein
MSTAAAKPKKPLPTLYQVAVDQNSPAFFGHFLKALWDRAPVAQFHMENGGIMPWPGNEAAVEEWNKPFGLGYFCCRAMKLASLQHFEGNRNEVRVYEQKAGEGAFARALAEAVRVDKAEQALNADAVEEYI